MLHIFHVVLYKVGKEDVAISTLLIQEAALIFLCLSLSFETSLADVLFRSGPIRIIEVGVPLSLAIS